MIQNLPLDISWKVVKFLVESSGVQRDFNANFLHLLSIARSTFRSRMSLIQSVTRDFCSKQIYFNRQENDIKLSVIWFPGIC